MRANTTTSTSRPRPKAWLGVLALAFAVCSLVAPSTAGAEYSSVNALVGGYDEPSQPVGGSDYSSLNALAGGYGESSQPGDRGTPAPATRHSTNAPRLTGAPSSEPTLVSGPTNPDDGFDWLSAAIGSAAAIALVALGGAAFLTVRRRTAVSTASTS
jgi:hypothetical protein